jgi:hypothetical protein
MHTMGLPQRTSSGGTPPRGKLKRRILTAFVLLLLLFVISPILIARTPLRNWLLACALPQLQGNIRIGSASLGWIRPPVFTDIEVRDSSGRMLLHIPRLEGSKSLAALLCRPLDLGEIRLTQPAVHIICSHDSSNLESVLAYWLQKHETPSELGIDLDGVAIRVAISEARVVLEDENKGCTCSFDPLDMTVAIPRDRRTPLHLELNAITSGGHHSIEGEAFHPNVKTGQLRAELSAYFVEMAGHAPHFRSEGEVSATDLPMEAAELFLRRLEPQIKLGGRLSASLRIRPNDGQPNSPDMRLEGTLSLKAIELSDSFLGPDVLRLQRVDAPLRIALDGSRLWIERLEIQSNVGKLSLSGMMDLSKDLRDALIQPGHHVEAELNLARLAEQIPNALHLTKDTRMQSGTLSLHLSSALRGDAVLWEGNLHTSDLQGLYQGQQITWKEPFSVVLTAHQEISDPLPVLERFRCDSDFLRLEMSGSLEEWTARGSFNLGRLCEHLSGFVDLGSLRVQGEGTLRAAARRNPRGGYRIESDIGFAQLSVADGARIWREDSLTLHLDLIGENGEDTRPPERGRPTHRANGYRIDSGALHVLAGKDGIDLDLLEPLASSGTGVSPTLPPLRARMRFHGDLERWKGRVTSLTGLLDGVRMAGQIDMDGRLRYEAETIQLEDLKIAGRAVRFQGFGLSVDEPSLDFTTSGRWLPARETLELQHTRLNCPTVTMQTPAVTMGVDPVGALQVTASGTVQGDVARLLSIPAMRGSLTGGVVTGRIDLRPDEGRQIVQFDLNLQNVALGSPVAPVWHESRVNLTGHGVYDVVKDSLRIVQMHLDSPSFDCGASGQINALHSDRELSDAALRWQAMQALGCQIGAGELRGQTTGGCFRAAPIEATLNQGRLRLEPNLRLDPLPMEVTLAKGRVIDRAHLTSAACTRALGYAVPVLAGVAQAEGEFSLDLQSGRLPIVELAKGDVAGWLTLHSAHFSGGPLVQELSVLLKEPGTLTLAKDHVVPFRMVNGRVYHTGLELHYPELTIRLSGSVGLEGSLSLMAEMPVPPKWLGSSKLAKAAIGNQTVRLPIAGTLSKPKIDEHALREASAKFTRDAAENALRHEMDSKVKKEAENGIRKLFRRK